MRHRLHGEYWTERETRYFDSFGNLWIVGDWHAEAGWSPAIPVASVHRKLDIGELWGEP